MMGGARYLDIIHCYLVVYEKFGSEGKWKRYFLELILFYKLKRNRRLFEEFKMIVLEVLPFRCGNIEVRRCS